MPGKADGDLDDAGDGDDDDVDDDDAKASKHV